ncbi:uncharacterized protein C4orf45 [Etheostoma spectabile]|uniref:Uncharacterized protein n=1 Tax=Etheostoma spectabile TaxID=54343 RepID=A0A5J5D6G8_9PERO|nr:uncharacterized protein C4orf45 homolog [Etheostoma spectabile]KAA8588633.1 hypothetical protein FQN60_009978 [Etheostoma spectabile]
MQNSEAAAGSPPQHGQRMLFTGPDGIGDYTPRSNYFPRYIGVGASSPEATGDLSYFCQAAPHTPPPTPRQGYVGEVGWGWQYNQLLNSGTLLSNMQIKKTELRTALEDRVTHRFQNQQYDRGCNPHVSHVESLRIILHACAVSNGRVRTSQVCTVLSDYIVGDLLPHP